MSARAVACAAERLALQRRGLALRSSLLRSQAVVQVGELQTALNWVDLVQDSWIWLRQRPLALMWPVAVVSAVWLWRKPARLWRLSWRAWSAWKLWQRLAPHLT